MLEVRLWRHLRLGTCRVHYLRSELGLDQYLHLVRYTIVPCNLDIGIKNKTTYLLCIGLISEAYRNPLHGVTKQKYPIPFLGQVSRTTRGWLASTLDVGRGNESRTEGLRISRSRRPDFEDFRGFANEERRTKEVGRFKRSLSDRTDSWRLSKKPSQQRSDE